MPRPFLIVAASLLLFPFAIGLAHGQGIETLSLIIADQMNKRNKAAVVSVLDFTGASGETTDLGQYLADEIAMILVNLEDGFDVVDQSVINEILKGVSFENAARRAPSLVRQIKRSTGVEMVILGTVTPFRDTVRVHIKMLDIITERSVWESTLDIKPDAEMKRLLAQETGPPASEKGRSGGPSPQFNNKYLQVTVTSMAISPKYKTALVGLLLKNIAEEDIKIALQPPSDRIYLVESSATLVDDSGIRCHGAETSGIKTRAFSLLTAKSSTVITISFNCEAVLEGEFAALTADFFIEAPGDRTAFSMGIPNIQILVPHYETHKGRGSLQPSGPRYRYEDEATLHSTHKGRGSLQPPGPGYRYGGKASQRSTHKGRGSLQ